MGFFQTCLGLHDPKDRSELTGIWERAGDEFSGCLICVEQEKNELVGKIIVSTPQMYSAGWSVGDRKWRCIQGDLEGRWQLLDLKKEYDTQKKKVLSTDYEHYWISLSSQGKKISLHQSKIPLFAAQIWKKVGKTLQQ
ncbi:MAG: hypothetical protein QE493_00285 [Verrucomicrobiae bacterium]|jgi:hypothetical protein|nr:hypothetical protein [Verrucomicrobiae bacterium]